VIFTRTRIEGAVVVDLERREDGRGFFARTFDAEEFRANRLDPRVAQCNVSWNVRAGTLRGMHYQAEAAPEPKYIRCTAGAIYDVIIDVRPDSPSYLSHFGVELTADDRRGLYVPPMCAHGYLTLTDGAEVTYQVGEYYTPEAERGIRHDDPLFNIAWPVAVTVISDKDRTWPLFSDQRIGSGR
jgi:dTDP-4-dehydrorhamnose 3,5-epimerase